MSTTAHVPVVVIGAGPTGVTVATLLAQYGVETLVLDRWSGVYPQPRAVHLDDEVMRILARLGVADDFRAISRPALGLRLVDGAHRVLAEFHRDTKVGVHGYPQANMFDQPELEQLLRINLRRYPQARLVGDAEVTGIVENRQGRVRVSYVDRRSGAEHAIDTDYVLGCDGANSLTRKHIGAAMADLRFEQRWLVLDIATATELGQWEGVHQVCDPRRAATYMRIGNTRYRWEFQLLPGETAADFSTPQSVAALIAPWTAGVATSELELVRLAEYTFRAQIADRWRRGPIFLLGDAAHLTPPFIGQGMGAGLRDAMNLAWKLAGVVRGELPGQVLDSYQRERKWHARQMILLALAVGWSMTGGGRAGNALRHWVVPRFAQIPGLRSKVIDSTTPALRRSGLVHKRHPRRDLAGTLCPNPLMPDGRRLDELRNGHFAIVTRAALNPGQRATAAALGVVTIAVDDGSHLAQWLRHGRVAAALVRPDCTVMAADRDPAALITRMTKLSGRTPPMAAGAHQAQITR